MSFPISGILDTFSVDSTPASGWSNAFPEIPVNLRAVSGVLAGDLGTNANGYFTGGGGGPYGPDCEAYITYVTGLVDGNQLLVCARLQGAGAANADGYCIIVTKVAGGANDTIQIVRIDNLAQTVLQTNTQEFSDGDAVGIQCVGNSIRAYYNPSGGSWGALNVAVTDTTYPTAGHLGLVIVGTGSTFDNFGGGTIPSEPPPAHVKFRNSGLRPALFRPGLAR